MTRFVGRHEHSLDVKGRIILPARYRANFDTLAYISKHTERCLALWTPEAFERKADEMEQLFGRSPAGPGHGAGLGVRFGGGGAGQAGACGYPGLSPRVRPPRRRPC